MEGMDIIIVILIMCAVGLGVCARCFHLDREHQEDQKALNLKMFFGLED